MKKNKVFSSADTQENVFTTSTASKNDMEEKKLMNKVVIFVCFPCTKSILCLKKVPESVAIKMFLLL